MVCGPADGFSFFSNDTATTEIYTLSLHDALPIYVWSWRAVAGNLCRPATLSGSGVDRKSTRLNSSHLVISYAVFCLKKQANCTAPTAPWATRQHRSARTRSGRDPWRTSAATVRRLLV